MFGSSGFGAGPSLFGASTASVPTFGASTFSASSSSSPFAFGSSLSQPTTTFGGTSFGATSAPSSSLFSLGSASKGTAPLFGGTPTTPAFGSTTSGLFAGTTSATASSPFGGLGVASPFGGSTTSFGAATPGFGGFSGKRGTGDPKYGTTAARDAAGPIIHHTITAMPAYEAKSFEELRFEDYAEGRKGAQQQQAGGLFGGMAGTTAGLSTGLFGASQPTAGFGMSSAAATPSTGFSLFGGTPAASTSAGLFGASQPATTSLFGGSTAGRGSSLFGALSTPSTQSSFSTPGFGSSLFGGGSTTSAFGATPSASTGFSIGGGLATPSFGLGTDTGSALFSSTGFGGSSSSLFGTPSSSSSLLGGGSSSSLFSGLGSTSGGLNFNLGSSSASGSSLFSGLGGGGSSSSGFGLGNLGSTSSLFSNPSTSSFSLFGGSPSSSSSSLFGGSSLFGSTSASTEPHLISTIQSNPYGTLPSLSPKSKGDAGADLASLGALKSPVKKAAKPQPHYKLTPRSAAKIQPRGYGRKLSVFDDTPSAELPTAKVVASPDIFQSRLKLTIDPESEMPEVTPMKVKKTSPNVVPPSPYAPAAGENGGPGHPIPSLKVTSPSGEARDVAATPVPFRTAARSSDPATPPVDRPTGGHPDVSITIAPTPKKVPAGTVHAPYGKEDQTSPPKSYPSYEAFSKDNNITIAKIVPSNGDANGGAGSTKDKDKTKDYLPVLTKPTYYTVPNCEELKKMTPEELSRVRDFKIGRFEFGSIVFRGETDLRGLNLDEIVVFHPHQIDIYPEGTEKPPVGKGLNKPALVTLEKCWPKDPKTNRLIKEPSRRVERFVKKLKVRSGTKFVAYYVKTGEWMFEVDSFA